MEGDDFVAQQAADEHTNGKRNNTVSKFRSAVENPALFDVRWHAFASILVLI